MVLTKISLLLNMVSHNPINVVLTTETILDTDKLEQKDNMHNMPKLDLSHKACDVANCMSCAINVMYAYFNSKHASSDKTAPRQHMNNKKHVRAKVFLLRTWIMWSMLKIRVFPLNTWTKIKMLNQRLLVS